ncbi:MAG: hypothetical protein E4H09_03470 [Spirochaetales bacterium]|nr:MAG: hypothetical protein E4H09_03470 [Spirochaetales bacterium]
MFENIIGQRQVVERLVAETQGRLLPPVLLFHGPDYSAKCSTALELARVLTCTGGDRTVPWGCPCRSCTQQRHLLHPDTLLLGGRYFNREIAVAAAALKRDDRLPLRYLLERAVRKLTRRFDPVLWEGDETRIKKVEPLLSALDEKLELYLPGSQGPDDKKYISGIDAVVDLCDKIADVTSLDSVPVNVIRRVSIWSHLASQGPGKVAIIENVDRLNDSARNALLKTLEEPPRQTYFVLTTVRRGAVIPTILSRARSYGFAPRGGADSADVIRKIFRDEPRESASIRDYFSFVDGRGFRPLAERFLEACVGNGDLELGLLDEIELTIKNMSGSEGFRYFAQELTDLLHGILRSSEPISPRVIAQWRDLLRTAITRVESYNVQPTLALEGLYQGMRYSA